MERVERRKLVKVGLGPTCEDGKWQGVTVWKSEHFKKKFLKRNPWLMFELKENVILNFTRDFIY